MVALERPLAGVRSLVACQTSFVRKTFLTLIALERLLAGVRSLVLFQTSTCCKTFLTLIALVAFHTLLG